MARGYNARFRRQSGWCLLSRVNLGICGLGTVATGVIRVLERNGGEIARRAGTALHIAHIGARRDHPGCDTSAYRVSRDLFAVVRDPEVDVVVELIGGCDTARSLILEAIAAGKHVVTANKALIALHGNEIFAAARERGVMVAFEAAVAGGIPIIKTLREGLSANRIEWLAGIINGTGNFILSEMRDKGRAFDDVLKEAQALGYAEADPTFDVEGIDAAHKLTILASIAFGIPLNFPAVYTEGISRLTPMDVAYAEELGYRIKHLGIARRSAKGAELRVHPTMIPARRLLANVNGVKNGLMIQGDAVGPTLFYGAGAGAEPTASAVIADLVDVARQLGADCGRQVPSLAFHADALVELPMVPIEAVESPFYLRIHALDRAGVLAKVATILSRRGISIEALIQKEPPIIPESQEIAVPIIMLTHHVVERELNQAIAEIEQLDEVLEPVCRIRVEYLATE